jgi:xanthine dehydrogenase YagT iron-sulfur-binding subunit
MDTHHDERRPDAAQAQSIRRESVRFVVNGHGRELLLDPRVTLLDALREHLHLTGTKKGCDRGQCGACTVLVNGRRINACLALAMAQEGKEIVTIEGLGDERALHPVQRAFVEHDAFQCGYCTPGQIVSAVALLDEARTEAASAATDPAAPAPIALTDEEIRERMSGNICRCGAYVNIVAAIRAVAGKD